MTTDEFNMDQPDEVILAKMAEAFATFEELRGFLPADFYNPVVDAISEFVTETQWQSNPELLRRVLPIILEGYVQGRRLQLESVERERTELAKLGVTPLQ